MSTARPVSIQELTAAYVHEIFRNLESGDGKGFFDHVAGDVDWIVEGTHPLAGHYHSKVEFLVHTFEKLAKVLPQGTQQGLTVFARISFSGDAEKVGLVMNPSQLLIFGNPKAGTPLMIASPSIAIDLPLKALAWEDLKGKSGFHTTSLNISKSGMGYPVSC